MSNSTTFIGIDPGKKGFITVWESQTFHFHQIPTIGDKIIDIKELSKILGFYAGNARDKGDSLVCGLEDVHAIYGASAKSTFEFGHGLGVLEGVLTSMKVPYTKISPKKWQKTMWQGIPAIKKKGSTQTDTKKMSEAAATRLFPDIDLRRNDRCRKSDDNKVDSLLICSYLIRTNLNL